VKLSLFDFHFFGWKIFSLDMEFQVNYFLLSFDTLKMQLHFLSVSNVSFEKSPIVFLYYFSTVCDMTFFPGLCVCVCVCLLLGMRPRVLCILGKCFTTELHPLPSPGYFSNCVLSLWFLAVWHHMPMCLSPFSYPTLKSLNLLNMWIMYFIKFLNIFVVSLQIFLLLYSFYFSWILIIRV
jgi:hypothetical protein